VCAMAILILIMAIIYTGPMTSVWVPAFSPPEPRWASLLRVIRPPAPVGRQRRYRRQAPLIVHADTGCPFGVRSVSRCRIAPYLGSRRRRSLRRINPLIRDACYAQPPSSRPIVHLVATASRALHCASRPCGIRCADSRSCGHSRGIAAESKDRAHQESCHESSDCVRCQPTAAPARHIAEA
jgi:hypothetical protein